MVRLALENMDDSLMDSLCATAEREGLPVPETAERLLRRALDQPASSPAPTEAYWETRRQLIRLFTKARTLTTSVNHPLAEEMVQQVRENP